MKGGDLMKKTMAFIVSFFLVFAFTGLSFAQEKNAAPAPAKEEKQMPEKKHAKKAGHSVRGEVTAVDATANTLTVKGKTGESTFTTDEKTKFPKGKTLADVKVGDKLTVKYSETDGKMVATSVMMKKARHHKKAMKKEKMEEENK
jgi:Na+-transporting methylmalonyl-CoA/oxaloacetate decarboxylase gamma subunit